MAISGFVARLRARIGHELLLLPSVAAALFDGTGRLLVVRHDNGSWAPPGGVVEPDERPIDAVVREVGEELGVRVAVYGLIGTYGGPEFRVRYLNGDETAYVITVYAGEIVSGTIAPDQDEISDARFVSQGEFATLPRSPWTHVVVPEVFAWHASNRGSRPQRMPQ